MKTKLLFLLPVLLISFAFVSASYWEENLDTGILGYFSYEDGSGTSLMNNITSSVNGSLTASGSFIEGKIGQGVSLQTLGTVINIPTYYANYWDFSGGYTFHTWLYETSWTNSGLTGSRQGGNVIAVETDTNGKVYVIFWQLSPQTCESDNGVIPLNEWFQFDLTYNLSQINLYINGEPVATCDATGTLIIPDGYNTPVGWDGDDPANNWKGYVDETGFWGRGLSSGEIIELNNGGAGIFYKQEELIEEPEKTGLMKNWEFDKLESPITGEVTSQGGQSNFSLFFENIWNWIKNLFK